MDGPQPREHHMTLSPVDAAIQDEIYPLIAEIEERLQKRIALALWINLTRKLATREQPLDKLQALLEEHYTHQAQYNASKNH